ncbi:MAG: hydrogenase maturation protease [Desulfatitalea sp.]|nr:hydrogenase maturation protease [Desulfatitalea sp.]
MKPTLIMGIGNLLQTDDGLGVHAVKALAERPLPADVVVLDVGTAFLEALPFLEQAERVLIIDAVQADAEPGTLHTLPVEKLAPRFMDSLHNFDIFGMLAMANNQRPVEVWVLGLEPERFGWGLELSPKVSRALPALLDAVCAKIEHTD